MLNIKKYKNIAQYLEFDVFDNNKALVYCFCENCFVKDFENEGYDKLLNELGNDGLIIDD